MIEKNNGELRLNLQKNRIDSLNGSFSTKQIGLSGFRVFNRRDILEIIWIQSLKFWPLLPAPKYILMDSYSELTDQLFLFGRKSFFANYGDLEKTLFSKKLIVSLGLLDTDNIKSQYNLFFENISKMWHENCQFNIYFIHFPHKFESRDFFIVRAKEIQRAIDELSLVYSNLVSIVIPEDLVNQKVNSTGNYDSFPYHFDDKTAEYVVREIHHHECLQNSII